MRVSQASMTCGIGGGNRPNGQHGGSRHRFLLRRVTPAREVVKEVAKGVAKNCVANFALDRIRIGASRSRQVNAIRIEKV